ncbi:hypothetical protein XHV734_3308 [Xanthomonas hortorum pv. vitians]|nr:hypothetical protein XHV734_3308 [Xanthomonas hortorum pv. vitians]
MKLRQSFGGSVDSVVVVVCCAHLISPLTVYESIKKMACVKFATIPILTCHRNQKNLKNKA